MPLNEYEEFFQLGMNYLQDYIYVRGLNKTGKNFKIYRNLKLGTQY